MHSLVLPVLASEAFAQIHLKGNSLPLGCVGYVLVAIMLNTVYKTSDISTFNTVWSALSVVSASLVGTLMFGETVTPRKMAGISLVLIAILMM